MEKESLFSLDEKKQIGESIMQMLTGSGMSAPKFAVSIGFTKSDISNIKNLSWVKNPQLIGEQKWIRLAQKARFSKDVELTLRTADTDIFTYLSEQFRICQDASTYGLMCDAAGIGKTYACKEYKASHANVMYIDCSLSPKATQFKRAFTNAAGISSVGRIDDCFEAAIVAIKQTNHPLLVLDEAGDLKDDVFRLIKRLYNELEDLCGIYLLGAGGLRKKIENGMGCNKVGFEEVFSRFGRDYGRRTPNPYMTNQREFEKYMQHEMEAVLLVNGFDRQLSARISENMKGRDLRAVKRAIKAARLSEM